MSAQLKLFDVPKDSPSAKEKLNVWKTAHGIWTHDAKWDGDNRWCALLVKNPWCEDGSVLPIEQIAEYARLLEEGGYLGFGDSEKHAIMELCRYRDIPCDL